MESVLADKTNRLMPKKLATPLSGQFVQFDLVTLLGQDLLSRGGGRTVGIM